MTLTEAMDYLKQVRNYSITSARDGKWHVQCSQGHLDDVVTEQALIEHAEFRQSLDRHYEHLRLCRFN